MKKSWEIIHECDTDDGDPTCYGLEINHEIYGKYVWISCILDGDKIKYDVEVKLYDDIRVLAECKSLVSAKRWVTMNLIK